MKRQKIHPDPSAFPPALHPLLRGGTLYDSRCHSGAAVYYCDTGYYVKVDKKGALAREAELARLFHKLGLGVEVAAYLSEEKDYLVTRSGSGADLTHWLDDPGRLCRTYARILRHLHGIPADGLPTSSAYQHYLDAAAGDFPGDPPEDFLLKDLFAIGSKEDALAIIRADRHRLQADTLIHGDPCLPNILLDRQNYSVFIDCAQAGVGDRHMDLYWAVWSLAYNLKTNAWTGCFLDHYGRDRFDPATLRLIAAFEYFG